MAEKCLAGWEQFTDLVTDRVGIVDGAAPVDRPFSLVDGHPLRQRLQLWQS